MNPRRSHAPLPLPFLAAILIVGAALLGMAQPAGAAWKLTYRQVATANQPTSLTSPPGHPRLAYVTERKGKIRILKGGKWLPGPFLDISNRVRTLWIEQGLLGLAFPPDFRKSHRYYVDYTARNGDVVIEEYMTYPKDPTRTMPDSRRLILRIPHVNDHGNHNGGEIAFLGNELYIAVGDGNDPGDAANNAQNLESLRGKILRIDPRGDSTTGRTYLIPSSNPYVNKPGRDEIFASGFRNPHSFDFFKPEGGETMMVISDVGQGRYEELNYLPFKLAWGANFGWHAYEGIQPYDCGELCPNGGPPGITTGLTWPQLVYSHEQGCAIIGGPVIEDPALTTVKGRIIYGDFCANRIRTAAAQTTWINDDKGTGVFLPPGKGKHSALNGFGEDGWGRVYALSNFGGIHLIKQIKVASKPNKPTKPGKKKKKKR
ncbi:MAG: PQQ-dependent sugar dehydrogenase [Solirubrobacterales bacterium]|nr:PQQ-dependent sugar dehydrogenase [Solirubrobacterales bacterium]